MSAAANKRKFLEAAHALVKASVADESHFAEVFSTLAQVTTDGLGRECELVLRLKADSRAAPAHPGDTKGPQ